MLFGGDVTYCFARETSHDYEKEEPSPFWRKSIHQSQSGTPETEPKRQKSFHVCHNRVNSALIDTVNQYFISTPIYLEFQSTLKQHSFLTLQRQY